VWRLGAEAEASYIALSSRQCGTSGTSGKLGHGFNLARYVGMYICTSTLLGSM
jgi:hypothetical protein